MSLVGGFTGTVARSSVEAPEHERRHANLISQLGLDESDPDETGQTAQGNQRSEEVPDKVARKWSREEMEEAEPYPIPEVPDDS